MPKRRQRPASLSEAVSSSSNSSLRIAHPLMLIVGLIATVIILASVTFDAQDPDLWHHLAVGRHIWQKHVIPSTQIWTWPSYGEPDLNYAWLFEAAVWKLWDTWSVSGLFVWRWSVTLATFGFAYAAARFLGAKNFVPFVVAALCAMSYRSRTLVRPEGVAALLLSAELAWLAARRHGRRPSLVWIGLIAVFWANTHVTYYAFFLAFGAHLLGRLLPGPSQDIAEARSLVLIGLGCSLLMLLNPYGWRFFWEPISIWSRFRGDPITQNLGELLPVQWNQDWENGLVLIVVSWALLSIWRAVRQGPDWTEWVLLTTFLGQLSLGQRFVGVLAIVALPYLSRDLSEWLSSPRWTSRSFSPPYRALSATMCCVLLTMPELRRLPLGASLGMTTFSPVGACDFIERNHLRGRFYNPYGLGGYLAYRFAGRREQLPFMSIHLEGGRELRTLYMRALTGQAGWQALDQRYKFDVLLLWQNRTVTDQLPMVLDRDTVWARVFSDDVACVYVRRDGPYAALARDSAYLALPADPRNLEAIGPRVESDSLFRRQLKAELERIVLSSPEHTRALWFLATIADIEGHPEEAKRRLRQALELRGSLPRVRDALGLISLQQNQPDSALLWFEAERRLSGSRYAIELRRGQVAAAKGDRIGARQHYERELKRDPSSSEARERLDALDQP